MIGRAIAQFARLISGARAHWIEPPTEATSTRQRVYFANHASHLDFVIIWSALPPEIRARTRPVAGADYWNRGRVRRYLANMNRILPKGEFLPVPLLGRVVFGAPMRLAPNEEKAAFLTRARDALLALRDQ